MILISIGNPPIIWLICTNIFRIEYDPGLCNAINEDDDLQNDEETIEDEKVNENMP